MRLAFYICEGHEQIVMTPETEHEKRMLALLSDGSRQISTYRGSFYECRGGWTRQGSGDESTIFVITKKQEREIAGEPDDGL